MKTSTLIILCLLLGLYSEPVLGAEFVLTDAAQGKDVGDWRISNTELGIDTAFSVDQRVLHGGKQEGVRVIDIDTGAMQITLVPTRGMDIKEVKSGDLVLGWSSPVKEIVNPAYIDLESRNGLGWLDGFNEMLVRCGYEWTGHPGEDHGYMLSLHGRAGNTPASNVLVIIDDKAPHTIRIRGKIVEKTFKFSDYQIWTELEVTPGEKRFAIHDELTNLGDYTREYQIIYHSNFGRPLLEKGALFLAAVKQISPFNSYAVNGLDNWQTYLGPTKGYDEMVYNIVPYADASGNTVAVLHNAKGNMGVAVGFNIKQLPVLSLWKNTDTEKQGYVTGIEPGTSYAYNRKYQRDLGLVPTIEPGESKRFDLTYTLLDSSKAVLQATKKVNALQDKQPAEVDRTPPVKLP